MTKDYSYLDKINKRRLLLLIEDRLLGALRANSFDRSLTGLYDQEGEYIGSIRINPDYVKYLGKVFQQISEMAGIGTLNLTVVVAGQHFVFMPFDKDKFYDMLVERIKDLSLLEIKWVFQFIIGESVMHSTVNIEWKNGELV